MDSKERVRRALAHEPVDRVPIGFFAIDFDTVERILGHETYLRAKAKSQIAFGRGVEMRWCRVGERTPSRSTESWISWTSSMSVRWPAVWPHHGTTNRRGSVALMPTPGRREMVVVEILRYHG